MFCHLVIAISLSSTRHTNTKLWDPTKQTPHSIYYNLFCLNHFCHNVWMIDYLRKISFFRFPFIMMMICTSYQSAKLEIDIYYFYSSFCHAFPFILHLFKKVKVVFVFCDYMLLHIPFSIYAKSFIHQLWLETLKATYVQRKYHAKDFYAP